MDLHASIPTVRGSPRRLFRLREDKAAVTPGIEAFLRRADQTDGNPSLISPEGQLIPLPPSLAYLQDGDIVRVNQHAGELRVLYRRNSDYNVLFFTERCNSRCLMCSQPPRDVEDGFLVDEILDAIPLMAPETRELCITGGEPTLLGHRLIEVIEAVKHSLPQTSLHMLSNGRLFSNLTFASKVARVEHPDFMIGIPLYSDIASKHDFVVQAKGAFDETIRGILNLARVGQALEIRVVIHKQSIDRLVETARFIGQNFPFVRHVALMGLELTGFTKSNLEALWIDPFDYKAALADAVAALQSFRVPAMIYNHPLCLIAPSTWRYAKRSISDWKNIYLPACEPCAMKNECGGFFASTTARMSQHISPLDSTLETHATSAILQ